MKFQTISARAEKLRSKPCNLGIDGLYYRVNYMLASATINANDTFCDTDVPQDSAEYRRVELSTLECLLCDCRDAEVQAWFRKAGFKF